DTDTKQIETSSKKEALKVTPVAVDGIINTKQEAVYRMINAIDYYHSIEVQFTYTKRAGELVESVNLSAINMPDNHLTQIEPNTDESGSIVMLYENGSVSSERFNEKGRSLDRATSSMRLAGADDNHAMTLAESIQVGKDGIKSYKARPDLNYFSNAKIVALPSDLALNLLENEATYEMTGIETICGRDTVILEGSLSEFNQTRYKADHFKLNVDAKTGVLLGMSFTQNGQEKDYLKVDSVSFDQLPSAFQ
ncbi:MAG: hypothetical protein H9W82_14355, partial [Lactobacillus sp.]|nr:hypothetical protein [Lactobacillus sp.]